MEYKKFIKIKIDDTIKEIVEMDRIIEEFSRNGIVSYTDYGNRKAILKEYKKENKVRFRFGRVKTSLLNQFVYEKELNKLLEVKRRLESKLRQYENALINFDDKEFKGAISPNHDIVLSVLEYGSKYGILANELLIMLISLFKINNNPKGFLRR